MREYSKRTKYLDFDIEIWYSSSAESWFYEIRKNTQYIKSNFYGVVTAGIALKQAQEYIDFQVSAN